MEYTVMRHGIVAVVLKEKIMQILHFLNLTLPPLACAPLRANPRFNW